MRVTATIKDYIHDEVKNKAAVELQMVLESKVHA